MRHHSQALQPSPIRRSCLPWGCGPAPAFQARPVRSTRVSNQRPVTASGHWRRTRIPRISSVSGRVRRSRPWTAQAR